MFNESFNRLELVLTVTRLLSMRPTCQEIAVSDKRYYYSTSHLCKNTNDNEKFNEYAFPPVHDYWMNAGWERSIGLECVVVLDGYKCSDKAGKKLHTSSGVCLSIV